MRRGRAVDGLDPAGWEWPPDAQSGTVAEVGRRKGRGEGIVVAAEPLGAARRVHDLMPDEDGLSDVGHVPSPSCT